MSGVSNITNAQDLDEYEDYEYGSEYSNGGTIWPAMKLMLKRQAILFRHNKYREKRNLSALIEDEEVNKSGITLRYNQNVQLVLDSFCSLISKPRK